jgi:outer membrane protein OmpA-like peptidoglycan-associated protein
MLLSTVFAQDQDIEGSKDHPLISRFAGSIIRYHNVKQFDAYILPMGKAVWDREKEVLNLTASKHLEGKVTRIFYEAPKGRSPLEIYRSYKSELKRAGFEILFSGAGEDDLGQYFHQIIYPDGEFGNVVIWDAQTRPQRYLAAKLSHPEGEVYVSLYTSLHNTSFADGTSLEYHPAFHLVVIEVKPMKEGLVTVDADALARDIARAGRVAVYGIYFDIGKADIKPESDPVLKEIAKLLRQNPRLKLHVVGHTHSIGDFAANMKLSQARADAVVKELVSRHGVDAKRLRAHGVGPLAPAASNITEEGRAKNRRVELVEQ